MKALWTGIGRVNGDFLGGVGDEGRDEEGMEGLEGGCDDIKQTEHMLSEL